MPPGRHVVERQRQSDLLKNPDCVPRIGFAGGQFGRILVLLGPQTHTKKSRNDYSTTATTTIMTLKKSLMQIVHAHVLSILRQKGRGKRTVLPTPTRRPHAGCTHGAGQGLKAKVYRIYVA